MKQSAQTSRFCGDLQRVDPAFKRFRVYVGPPHKVRAAVGLRDLEGVKLSRHQTC